MGTKIVFYIGNFDLPDNNAAAVRVINNGKLLDKLGYKVVFIGITRSSNLKKNEIVYEKFGKFEFYQKKYPQSIKEWFKHLISINDIVRIINKYKTENEKIVILYDYPAIASAKMYNFCKKNNIKIIAECAEWYGSLKGNLIYKTLKTLDTYYRMHFTNKVIKNVICVSDYLENFYNTMKCHTVNIPFIIDVKDEKWQLKNPYKPNHPRKFIYAGNPGKKEKKDRIDVLIDAFFEIHNEGFDFELQIFGLEEKDFIEEFPEYSEKIHALGNKVVFNGIVKHSEVIDKIKYSDFTIFFRDNDRKTKAGFPTKFVESISCGTPVITNPSSNLRRFATNYNSILANDFSFEEFKKSIVKALELTDEQLAKMASMTKVNNPFNIDSFYEKMKIFFSKLV